MNEYADLLVGVFVCGMVQNPETARSTAIPVLKSVSQALIVSARGVRDPHLFLATLVALAFVPVLQAGIRGIQYTAAFGWSVGPYPAGMGGELLIATTCYVSAGLSATWLETLLQPKYRARWYAALKPRRSLLWLLPFLAGYGTLLLTGILGSLSILRPAFLGDPLSIVAAMLLFGAMALLLFVCCLPIGRLSLLPLRSMNGVETGPEIGWHTTRGNTLRIASVLTLVLMVWTIIAAIVFAGFATGRWPVAHMLFAAPDAFRLADLVQTILLETRELYIAFPGAVLMASCIAVIFRNLRGGVSTDVAEAFD